MRWNLYGPRVMWPAVAGILGNSVLRNVIPRLPETLRLCLAVAANVLP
jgi:hypothetical protein